MSNTAASVPRQRYQSLIEEMYLTGEVKRPELVEYVKNKHINYSMYGK